MSSGLAPGPARLKVIYIYMYNIIVIYKDSPPKNVDTWSRPPSLHPPTPNGLGPQVAPPLPFYLQAIGRISEVQLRIC